MMIARNRTKSHFMDQIARALILSRTRRISSRGRAKKLSCFFASREKPMPEPADGWFFFVAPGVMTILAIKFLGNNLHRPKESDQGRRQVLAGHLWILNVRRSALWTTNDCRGDVGIARFPSDH